MGKSKANIPKMKAVTKATKPRVIHVSFAALQSAGGSGGGGSGGGGAGGAGGAGGEREASKPPSKPPR